MGAAPLVGGGAQTGAGARGRRGGRGARPRSGSNWTSLRPTSSTAAGPPGVEVGSVRPGVAVAGARAAAVAERDRISEALSEVSHLRSERAGKLEEAVVAREVGRQLRADHFERWLLEEAMRLLADGANRRLVELGPRPLFADRRFFARLRGGRPFRRRRAAQRAHPLRRRDLPRLAGAGALSGRSHRRIGGVRPEPTGIHLPRRGVRDPRRRDTRSGGCGYRRHRRHRQDGRFRHPRRRAGGTGAGQVRSRHRSRRGHHHPGGV